MARYYIKRPDAFTDTGRSALSESDRTGRFNSPDPFAGSLADPESLNHYTYVRNDPVDMVDPLGLDGCGPGTVNGQPGIVCDSTAQPPPPPPATDPVGAKDNVVSIIGALPDGCAFIIDGSLSL